MRRLAAALAVTCACAAAAFGAPFEVSWTTGMEKVMRTGGRFNAPPVRVAAMAGETEPFQIVIRPAEDLPSVEVWADDLVGPARIPAAAAELLRVEYVHVAEPSERPDPKPDDWPDPLPAADAPMEMKAGRNHPIWVALHVPANAPAGLYRGSVRLAAGEQEAAVPVELTVWPFALPDNLHMGTAYGISYGYVERFYGLDPASAEWREVMDAFYWFLVAHHLCPYSPPVAVMSPEAAWYLGDPRVTDFRAPYSDDPARLREIVDYLREKGWLGKAYWYPIDEPKPDQYERVRQISRTLRSVDPGLRFLLTLEPVPELYGCVDRWVPLIGDAPRERLLWRMRRGEEVWWYPCVYPHWPRPTYFIDEDGITPRMLFWQQMLYHVTGSLYWSTTHWPKPENDGPWGNPRQYPAANGDGFLLYPALEGPAGPVASIRLKNVRDGIEDYAMLALLRNRLGVAAANLGADYDPQARVDELCREVTREEIFDFSRDPADLVRLRGKVAREIAECLERPRLLVRTRPGDDAATDRESCLVEGWSERGARITVDGEPVRAREGRFRTHVRLRPGANAVVVRARLDGAVKTAERRIVRGSPSHWYASKRVSVPRMETGPELTAPAGDAGWHRAAHLTDFRQAASWAPAALPTEGWLCYDEEALYVAVRCGLGDGSLTDQASARDDDLSGQDAVEVVLLSDHRYHDYHVFAVTPVGNIRDELGRWNPGWNADWQAATRREPGAWTAVLRIPFAALGVKTPAPGEAWRFNVRRRHQAPREESTFSPVTRDGFRDAPQMAVITFR
jgi:hypothetical protein